MRLEGATPTTGRLVTRDMVSGMRTFHPLQASSLCPPPKGGRGVHNAKGPHIV